MNLFLYKNLIKIFYLVLILFVLNCGNKINKNVPFNFANKINSPTTLKKSKKSSKNNTLNQKKNKNYNTKPRTAPNKNNRPSSKNNKSQKLKKVQIPGVIHTSTISGEEFYIYTHNKIPEKAVKTSSLLENINNEYKLIGKYKKMIANHNGNCWIESCLVYQLYCYDYHEWEILFKNINQCQLQNNIIKLISNSNKTNYKNTSQISDYNALVKLYDEAKMLILKLKSPNNTIILLKTNERDNLIKFIKQTYILHIICTKLKSHFQSSKILHHNKANRSQILEEVEKIIIKLKKKHGSHFWGDPAYIQDTINTYFPKYKGQISRYASSENGRRCFWTSPHASNNLIVHAEPAFTDYAIKIEEPIKNE